MILDLIMVKARNLWGIQRAVLEASGQTSLVRETTGGVFPQYPPALGGRVVALPRAEGWGEARERIEKALAAQTKLRTESTRFQGPLAGFCIPTLPEADSVGA